MGCSIEQHQRYNKELVSEKGFGYHPEPTDGNELFLPQDSACNQIRLRQICRENQTHEMTFDRGGQGPRSPRGENEFDSPDLSRYPNTERSRSRLEALSNWFRRCGVLGGAREVNSSPATATRRSALVPPLVIFVACCAGRKQKRSLHSQIDDVVRPVLNPCRLGLLRRPCPHIARGTRTAHLISCADSRPAQSSVFVGEALIRFASSGTKATRPPARGVPRSIVRSAVPCSRKAQSNSKRFRRRTTWRQMFRLEPDTRH